MKKNAIHLLSLLALIFVGLSGIFAVNPNPVFGTTVDSVFLGTGLANSPTLGWSEVVLSGVKSPVASGSKVFQYTTSEVVAVKASFGPTGSAQKVKGCVTLGTLPAVCQEVTPAGQKWPGFFLTFQTKAFPGLTPGNYPIRVQVWDDGVLSPSNFSATIKLVEGRRAALKGVVFGAGLTTSTKPGQWLVKKTTALRTGHLLFNVPEVWVFGAKQFRVSVLYTPKSGAGKAFWATSDWRVINFQFFEGQVPPIEVGNLSAGYWTRRTYVEFVQGSLVPLEAESGQFYISP